MQEKLIRLVELKKLIDSYKKEFDSIKKEIGPEIDESIDIDGFVVSKYIKLTYKLKENVDELDMVMEYPELSKQKFDVNTFVKKHWDVATDFVDVKETDVVTISKSKK